MENAGLIEMVVVFGIVLGLAVYELISVRRSMRNDETRRQMSRSSKDDHPR